MLSNACFCKTVLNGSGVTPPLVLSLALLADFVHPAKSEDASHETEHNRQQSECLLERRMAAERS